MNHCQELEFVDCKSTLSGPLFPSLEHITLGRVHIAVFRLTWAWISADSRVKNRINREFKVNQHLNSKHPPPPCLDRCLDYFVDPRYSDRRDCPYDTTRTLNLDKWKSRSIFNHHSTICKLFLITQTLVSSRTRSAAPEPNTSFGRFRTRCRRLCCMHRSFKYIKRKWKWRQMPTR